MLLGALHSLIGKISAASERRWLSALGLVSLVPRVVSALVLSTVPMGDFSWYDDRAAELAAGLGYQHNGAPTSFWPPGYPFVLSLVYRLFGHSWLAGMLLNALLGTLICVLTYLIAKRVVGLTRARVAGLLVALFPSQILFTNLLGTEILFTVLLLLVIYLLLRRPVARQDYLYVGLIGATVGLAALVKTLVLFLPVVLFIWWLIAGVRLKPATSRLTVAFVCCFAVITPWTVRNLVRMEAPVLLSTSGGPNLWIGNNPEATGYFYFPPGNPLENPGDFAGEAERDAEGYRLALEFASQHPLRVLALMPKKVYHLFASDVYAANTATRDLRRAVTPLIRRAMATLSQHYYLTVLGLALVSISVLRGWWQHPGVLIVLVIGYWALVHAVFFGSDRFHFPLAPLMCILATHALATFWAGARPERPLPPTQKH